MAVHTGLLRLETAGDGAVVDLTDGVRSIVRRAEVDSGVAVVFAVGSTLAVTTMEYEPGGVADLQALLAVMREDGVGAVAMEVSSHALAYGRTAAIQYAVAAGHYLGLALDRALDTIGEAERRLAAEMVGNGATGPAAVDAWVGTRAGEVERIRTAVHGIASSGLTLSKLSVAASLLGDLVKH